MQRFLRQSRLKVLMVLLALAVGLVFTAGEGRSQQLLESYAHALPDIPFMPQKDFESKTLLYEDVPAGDKALSYRFRLPKDWKKPEDFAITSYKVSNKILGEIVRFYGPPIIDSRSFFTMQVLNLEYPLTAEQWILQYLLSNSFTIQGMSEHGDKRAEALYVKVMDSVTYVIRAVAQMNGKRIVLAEYYMPADNWEAEKQMQAQVMSTFQLTNPVVETVEEMTKYQFLDISEFQYPNSWEFKPAPLTNADRMSFELFNIQSKERIDFVDYKTLNGRIQVNILSYDVADTLENESENLKRGLSKINLTVVDKIETRTDFKFSNGVTARPVEVYKVMDNQSSLLGYEYWLTVMEAGGYYYFVGMITPSRDEDFFVWARNTQTYKLILESFSPLEEGLIYR